MKRNLNTIIKAFIIPLCLITTISLRIQNNVLLDIISFFFISLLVNIVFATFFKRNSIIVAATIGMLLPTILTRNPIGNEIAITLLNVILGAITAFILQRILKINETMK